MFSMRLGWSEGDPVAREHVLGKLPLYEGVPIRRRGEMLNLTDMWRAAGSDPNKRPADWARKEGAQFVEFISENLNMPLGHIIEAERAGVRGACVRGNPPKIGG